MSFPSQSAASSAGGTFDSVLVVDDEEDTRRLVTSGLTSAGFKVDAAATGRDALAVSSRLRPSVIVLDVMLPDVSGVDVCRRLRADDTVADAGILILSARSDESDRLLGFEVGADDYVTKPFSMRELVMRVRSLATRAHDRRIVRSVLDPSKRLAWGSIQIETSRHRVTINGEELMLRPLEYKLLATFLDEPGRVWSRYDLLQEVWGISPDTNTRTVDTHIRRLRERLGGLSEAIETVHGFGYRLREHEK